MPRDAAALMLGYSVSRPQRTQKPEHEMCLAQPLALHLPLRRFESSFQAAWAGPVVGWVEEESAVCMDPGGLPGRTQGRGAGSLLSSWDPECRRGPAANGE